MDTSSIKNIIETCRQYFITLSARTTPYAYFNFIENTVILSNSTSGGGKGAVHGDRIINYRIGELSYHFIKFKNADVFKSFKELFKIPDEFYCVHVVNLFALLNKVSYGHGEVLEVENNLRIYRGKGSLCYDKKNIYGCPVTDFHLIRSIQEVVIKVSSILDDKFPKIKLPVDIQQSTNKGLYFVKVSLDIFKDSEGKPIFEDYFPLVYITTVDGLSTVNIKTFVRKLKNDYVFNRYVWVDHKCVDSLTIFENDDIESVTYCPNFISIPISKKYQISFKVKQ